MPLVMVVDDAQSCGGTLLRLLNREGYATLPAHDPRAAVDLLHSMHPDLIVTDVHAPTAGGLELLEALQQHPQFKSIPVVMLTSQTDTHCLRRAEQLGAKEFLIKATFSLGQTLDQVKRYARAISH
jgi:CheY-like chemotaxis protein